MDENKQVNRDKFYDIAHFIVQKRKLFFFVFIILSIASVFGMQLIEVEDDLIQYLNEESDTVIGLNVMEGEFITYGTASIMVSNIDYDTALSLSELVAEVEGVKMVVFSNTSDYYKDASALFSVTFAAETGDDITETALDDIKILLADYDVSYDTDIGYSQVDMLLGEMKVIIVVVIVLVLSVLSLTSRAYMEVPVLLITFAAAALLNKGCDFIFGEISFVSNSVAVVLQLALAIDYAIILCHRYSEECEHFEPIEACTVALSKAIIEISSSSLTTIAGLFAMSFMDYGLGGDLSKVLIKSIFISLFCVFTLMPGLLVLFSNAIEKTRHKSFMPSVRFIAEFSIKFRKFILPIFCIITIASFYLSNQTEYLFSVNEVRAINISDRQLEADRVTETFGTSNAMVILFPSGNYELEALLIADLESYDEITSVTGLANTEAIGGYMLTDLVSARELSELLDLDYEVAALLYSTYAIEAEDYAKLINQTDDYELPLIDVLIFAVDMIDDGYVSLDGQDEVLDGLSLISDAVAELETDNYSRLLVSLNLADESEETFAFLDVMKDVCVSYYEEVYFVGSSTSNYDLSSTFASDNLAISILSALFVVCILLFTFGSVAVPIMLIIVIQAAIFINFAVPYVTDTGVFFIGYLVVSSIQMGANVDYGIVITNRFLDLRKSMDKKEAIIQALDQSFTTVMTSGSMLAAAGIIIMMVTTDGTISAIGTCIGRGTIISMILVIFILPSILYVGEALIDKTEFALRIGRKKTEVSGKIHLEGHVKGYVSGYVDAKIYGSIRGEVNATIDNTTEEVATNEV